MRWLVLLLMGCFEPDVTGPNGMVGRILDEEGKPVAGIRVTSEEHGDLTDLEGRFAVQYKEPSQYVRFLYEGLTMTRTWQSEGDQPRVLMRLPPLHDLEMFCNLSFQCSAEFTWALDDHLEATTSTKCLPGIATGLVRVPLGEPKVVCRSVSGAMSVPRVVLEGRTIRLLPPPSPIRVSVHDRERRTPSNCAVYVDGKPVDSVGGGIWIGEANDKTTVFAICEGQPAVPRYIKAEQADRVVLQWLGTGPTLKIPSRLKSQYGVLYLQSDTVNGGWRIKLEIDENGAFRLPPLPTGDYRLSVGDSSILSKFNSGDPAEPNVVIWSKQQGGYMGSLRLTQQRVTGSLVTRGLGE